MEAPQSEATRAIPAATGTSSVVRAIEHESAVADGRTAVVLACLGWLLLPCWIGAIALSLQADKKHDGAGDLARGIVFGGIIIYVTIGIIVAVIVKR